MDESTFEPEEIDLRAYWRTLSRRRYTVLASLVAVIALVSLLTFTQKPVYQATAKILARGSRNNQADLLSSTIPALGAFADQRDVQTQVEIIRSRPLLKEAARRSDMEATDATAFPVKVEGGKDSNIITITASSVDPERAQHLANNVANVYVEHNLAEARGSAHLGRVFLEGQQDKLSASLKLAARALRDYQARTGVVNLDAEAAKRVESLATLESTLVTCQTDHDAAEARIGQIRDSLSRTSANVLASSQIAVNPTVQRLQDEIAELNVQRSGLLNDFQPDSRKVRALDAQIRQASAREKAAVRDILANRTVSINPVHQQLVGQLADAEGESLSSRARITGISRSIAQQRAVLKELPQQQYRLAELQRAVSVAEKTYLALQDRYQQLRIAEESTLANASILEPAVLPASPVSPKVKLNLILAVLVGLMLGVGLAALQEALDDAIWTGEDVERELALPLLGVVHNISEPAERSLRRAGPMSSVAEAFRLIRSNIKFMGVDKELRCIMVSSASKGEGKSTTAANLAIALAQDGRRVILIDADLRRPSVHRQFEIANTAGLTNVIASGMPIAEVQHDVGVDNLCVVTAGPIPPNPAELLDSTRFAHLVEELGAQYDSVVFDAPPVLGVADASVLGGRMDGVVLVIAAGDVERGAARRTHQMLQQARSHVLGVVLNKASQKGGGYYNYYYYQYHEDGAAQGRKGRGRRTRIGSGR